MSLPRTARIACSLSRRRSTPASLTDPPTIFPGGSETSRISDSAVMLLPQPDSPTIASVSAGRSEKLTPSTAFRMPRRRLKTVRRSRTSSRASPSSRLRLRESEAAASCASDVSVMPGPSTPQPGIEKVAQRIAEEVGSEHREADRQAGINDEPRCGAYVFGRRFGQHAAPRGIRLGNAETEERQGRLDQNGGPELGRPQHDQRRQRV